MCKQPESWFKIIQYTHKKNIEPLAIAVHSHPRLVGQTVEPTEHIITLFADVMLLKVSISLQYIFEIVTSFTYWGVKNVDEILSLVNTNKMNQILKALQFTGNIIMEF